MNNIDCGRKLPPRNRDDNAFHTFCSFFFAGGGGRGRGDRFNWLFGKRDKRKKPRVKAFQNVFHRNAGGTRYMYIQKPSCLTQLSLQQRQTGFTAFSYEFSQYKPLIKMFIKSVLTCEGYREM